MENIRNIALLIDLANSEELNFTRVVERAAEFGRIEEAKAYGDYRQRHLTEKAGTLYALGFELVHCPSWPNGGTNVDRSPRWKRTHEVLMQKGALNLCSKQEDIDTFVIVTGDADIIPTCQLLYQRGKRVVVMHQEGRLGLVFQQCPDFEFVPLETDTDVATTFHDDRHGDSSELTPSHYPAVRK